MDRKKHQLESKALVVPENLKIVFMYQDLLGRGLKAWKKKKRR